MAVDYLNLPLFPRDYFEMGPEEFFIGEACAFFLLADEEEDDDVDDVYPEKLADLKDLEDLSFLLVRCADGRCVGAVAVVWKRCSSCTEGSDFPT